MIGTFAIYIIVVYKFQVPIALFGHRAETFQGIVGQIILLYACRVEKYEEQKTIKVLYDSDLQIVE